MKKTLLLLSVCITSFMVAQVSGGQVDDFQDGTIQNWQIGNAAGPSQMPMNIPDAGPNADGDNCLQYTSTGGGGAASKMVIYTQNQQWSGNFTSQGIGSIDMDVRVQTNALNLRIAMQGSDGTRICSTDAIAVAADGVWTAISIPVDPTSFTVLSGGGDASTVLANVTTLRLLSSNTPTWQNVDTIASILQVDNITANPSLSISELSLNANDFTISPNPARDRLNIALNNIGGSVDIEIFDVLGKRIFRKSSSQFETSINVSNWKSGVYLVRVSNNDGTQTKRFIKQ